MRLWQKFIFVSLVIAWVPLGWLGFRLEREVSRSLTASSFQIQSGLADRTVDMVNGQIDAAVNLLTGMGRNLSVRSPGAVVSRTLGSALNTQPILTDLWVHDRAGRLLHALHRFKKGRPVSSSEWPRLRAAVDRDGVFLGRVQIVPPSHPRLLTCVPILSPANNIEGYLVARLNLFVLAQSLGALAEGAGGKAYLLDPQGAPWAESNDDKPERPPRAPAPWTDPRWTQGEYKREDGSRVLGVKKPLRGLKGWVVFERPRATALAVADKVRRRVWRSLAFATGFAVLLAVFFGVFITKSLHQFMDAVQRWTTGHFGSLITIQSHDELGDLAHLLKDAQPILEKRARDSVLGRMTRFIGHDLRQLVQALRNSLAAILSHVNEPDAQAAKHFLLSYETLDWMEDFIEDILTIGRDRPLNAKKINANQFVQRLIPKLRPPEGCRLTTSLASPAPQAWMEESEARKALLNAAKNALEAIGSQGEVVIGTETRGEGVAIWVRDNGAGFPEEKRRHLFEETTTKETGSGLGLLVIKKVMDQHGGRVDIASAEGRGTTLTLLFPTGADGENPRPAPPL